MYSISKWDKENDLILYELLQISSNSYFKKIKVGVGVYEKSIWYKWL